jgi:2-haloacid dehalogenase
VNNANDGATPTQTQTAPQWPPSLLVFDVNETLLDIEVLAPHFTRIFGDASVLRTWFGELVMYSMTLTLAGYYTDFFTLGQAVLTMIADIRHIEITNRERQDLVDAMRTVPAHPDAPAGLQRLLNLGYRLVTLTNSPHHPDTASPLDNAGLSEYFERQFSVDSSRVFKPSPFLYRHVAHQIGVPTSACMMVAAHMWDTIGAQAAGLSSALITRRGNAALSGFGIPQPTLVAADLNELATKLGQRGDTPPTPHPQPLGRPDLHSQPEPDRMLGQRTV